MGNIVLGGGGGVIDATPMIQESIDTYLDTSLPTGNYRTTGTIHLKAGCSLSLEANAVLMPAASFDVVRVYNKARLTGGKIDSSGVKNFTHAHILIEGKKLYGGDDCNDGALVSFMELTNNQMAPSGYGVRLVAREEGGAVAGCDISHMKLKGFGTAISLEATAKAAYVNANNFTSIGLDNFINGLYLDVDWSKGGNQVNQNIFTAMQIQAETLTKIAIDCNGESNQFNFLVFDLRLGQKAIVFTPTARDNQVFTDYDSIKKWIADDGVNNYFAGRLELEQKFEGLIARYFQMAELKAKTGKLLVTIDTEGNFGSASVVPKGT